MSLYSFSCECGEKVVQLRRKAPICKKCGKNMERTPEGAGSQQVETLDNGLMVKALEQRADMTELVHDYAQSDPRKNR